MLPKLAKAKVFSIFDAKDGFHQVLLDEKSSYLTTFWAQNDRYRYLRLPFGLCSASEEFQRRLHEILSGIEGVEVIADDILVYGCGETFDAAMKDHDKNVISLFETARANNLKLNKEKMRLKTPEVEYMGNLLTNQGLKPDPGKVEALLKMPRPTDKKAVMRFNGFVNYMSRFCPHLAELAKPLRKLTEKDVMFVWEKPQEEAYTQIVKLVSEAPILQYFDVNKPVVIQCDSSESGLGATLLQDGLL